MADDPDNLQNRLERHAGQPVPPIDPAFASRLESQLRVDHAVATSPRPWTVRSVMPRLVAAGLLVMAGVAGIVSLTADDAGVPVAVVPDEQSVLLDEPALDDGALPADVTVTSTPVDAQGTSEAPAVPPVTPTPPVTTPPVTPTPPMTTPSDAGSADPTAAPFLPTDPTPTSLPTQSTVPLPSATPTDVPTATAIPTAPPTATPIPILVDPTAVPVPSATALPEPTPAPTPEPAATTTPTPEAEPAPIDVTCATRTAADVVGVVCTWVEPVTDQTVSWYEVLRSRNGGEAEIVSRQRATAATSYVDRSVVSGDDATYLVRALAVDERVVAASIRQIVQVP